MMIEKLLEILKASPADDWQIRDTAEEGWEFYFIAHKLDQNRVRSVDHVILTEIQKAYFQIFFLYITSSSRRFADY